MHITSIVTDGDFQISRGPTRDDMVTVYILANPDAATITLGYQTNLGAFKAFTDGASPSDDTLINCGGDVILMARVAGTGAGTLVIGCSQ